MKTYQNYTNVELQERFKVLYKVKRMLGGLVKWDVVEREDMVARDLHIQTQENFNNIYVNGVKL